MSVGKKLYYGFGAILGIVLILFIVNLFAVMNEHSAKKATNAALVKMQAMDAIRAQMMQNRLLLSSYLLSGDTRDLDSMNSGVTRVGDLLREAEAKFDSEDQRTAMRDLKRLEADWSTSFANVLIAKRKDVDAGNSTVADLQVQYLMLEPAAWLKRSVEPLDAAEANVRRALEANQASAESAGTITIGVNIAVTILAILLGIGIAFKVAKMITDPLARLNLVAREIGDSGDLEHDLDTSGQDEIGDLARSFNKMVIYLKEMAAVSEAIAGGDLSVEVEPRSKSDTLGNAFQRMTQGLRSLVKNVRDGASQVASGANQVADASEESAKVSMHASSAIDEVTSTMHEMSINVQNMVKNTQTQASSVSETSASIDQMVASIQRVADTAKVLLDISHRSREEVQSGIGTMEKATDGLNRINVAIQQSAEIIGSLGQRADDIGKIIEVIDDLAEQTNLLALNAAIEAARAGEHGLGFAVVADEVRKLAEKSAASTKEISELIQSIQKEARKAVENMDRSTGIVNEGLTLGSDLSMALRKISNVVTEVYKFAQEIGAATNEQSHGSSQIAKSTTRLNEITHEINSSVEEQASGAQAVMRAMEKMRELVQQTTSGSTELAASAEQMSKMSRSLLEQMDRFALDNMNGDGHHGLGRREPMDRGYAARYAASARS